MPVPEPTLIVDSLRRRTAARAVGRPGATPLRSTLLLLPGLLALAGCQAVQPTPTSTQVRVIDASPDAPGLDIYSGGSAIAYNLGFGTVTSYVGLAPGIYTMTADTAGSKQILTSAKATLVTANQYTILLGNSSSNLQELVLTDQVQAAPSGQIALRFLDEATRVAAVDVYLVPAGAKLTAITPVLTNVSFPFNSGYVNVPAGTYTLVLVPTGTVPTSTTVATYTGSQAGYTGGSATTIILIDQQLVTTPGLQVLSVPDYTSPTATS